MLKRFCNIIPKIAKPNIFYRQRLAYFCTENEKNVSITEIKDNNKLQVEKTISHKPPNFRPVFDAKGEKQQHSHFMEGFKSTFEYTSIVLGGAFIFEYYLTTAALFGLSLQMNFNTYFLYIHMPHVAYRMEYSCKNI